MHTSHYSYHWLAEELQYPMELVPVLGLKAATAVVVAAAAAATAVVAAVVVVPAV